MTARQKFYSLCLLLLLSLGLVLGCFFMLLACVREENAARERRYQSYLLADELRQSSDDLTRLGRTYVVTGDPAYEKQYFDILDIRSGKKPRPEAYHRIYWDFVAAGEAKPRPDSALTAPLLDLMKKLGFTSQEFAKLEEAQKNSDGLVKNETIAMYAVKGLFDDGKGGFTKKGQPDREMALRLTHDKDYHAFKAKIMKPVDDFFVLLEERTGADIARASASTLRWGYIALALMGVMTVCIVLSVTFFAGVLRQLGEDPGYLHQVSSQIASGDLDVAFRPQRVQGGVYAVMRQMVDTMKAKIAEANEKAAQTAEETRRAQQAMQEAQAAKEQAEQAKSQGMRQAAQQLEETVAVMACSSGQLSAGVGQARQGSAEQAGRVGETAAAMEEMNATVLEVAKNAGQAAQTAEAARQKAQAGADVVNQVVSGIGVVRQQAALIEENMAVLGKQAEGIGQILNVISDIADQTNLLALNAAIEAARAGEAGRGFAVVADEVRKLAEKTMTATKEVGEAINGIQEGTRRNIGSVGAAGKAVEEATALASTSGEALREIVTLVECACDQVRSIAAASEEQSAASEEINRALDAVNNISGETANVMGQAAGAVDELNRQAQVLRELIDQMKSDNGGVRALAA